jgi:hypothetical protein
MISEEVIKGLARGNSEEEREDQAQWNAAEETKRRSSTMQTDWCVTEGLSSPSPSITITIIVTTMARSHDPALKVPPSLPPSSNSFPQLNALPTLGSAMNNMLGVAVEAVRSEFPRN